MSRALPGVFAVLLILALSACTPSPPGSSSPVELVEPVDQVDQVDQVEQIEADTRTIRIQIGRQCGGGHVVRASGRARFPPAIPQSPGDVTRALRHAGVQILAKEELVRCQGCGCPALAVAVEVPTVQAARVERIAARWGG